MSKAEPTLTLRRSSYGAKNLLVLEGLEAVQKRPAMYIGSTDLRGLMHCLWEVMDNSVDEALSGFGTEINVWLNADGSIEVHDHGRGIPVDTEPHTGLSGVEVVYTRLHAGGKFNSDSYTTSGGLHGVGASVVNALSERLDVEVDRDGHTYAMSFSHGRPGLFDGDGPQAPFTEKSGLRKTRKTAKSASGTRVRYWPDPNVFKDTHISFTQLVERGRQTSFLIPGLRIVLTDRRDPGTEQVEEFYHKEGISTFAEFLATDEALTPVIRITGTDSFVETVPVVDANGVMTPTDMTRRLEIDIAVRWGLGYDTVERSFVNIVATPNGGTHLQGFERGLLRAFTKSLDGTKLIKKGEEIVKDDVLEGMTAVVTVRLPEPQFEGQTKSVLGTPQVTRLVQSLTESVLAKRLSNSKPNSPERRVLEKVVNAGRTRVAARAHKETVRRKNALESSTMPPKLKDCRSTDVDRTELFIVEGDSALGTANLARNSEFQALLPIRGKILNVQKASIGDMLKNAECAAIIQVVGAGSGRTFDLDQARYGKVIFMADADSDGAHIRCLLATLFFKYMRPMIEAGRVYSAVPPLHRFELIKPKKGAPKYLYTYSDPEYHRKMAELTRAGQTFKEPQRYKGLGEMDADQLAETTMNPKFRTLRRLTVADAQAAESVFEVLMGRDVDPRKEFIVDGAYALDQDRIDA